jgi:ribosome-associated protein
VTGDKSNPTLGTMRLDHFVKLTVKSGTGGQAKFMIQNGEVKVNGEIETRRRRKLSVGDVVEVGGKQFPVKESGANT